MAGEGGKKAPSPAAASQVFHTGKVRETSESIKGIPSRTPLFSIAQPSPPLPSSSSLKVNLLKKFFFSQDSSPTRRRRVKHKSDYFVHANQSPPVPISLPFVRLAPDFMGNAPFSPFQPPPPPREKEAQVFREWGMKPRVVDVDLVNIALSAIFSRKQREREGGRGRIDERRMDIPLFTLDVG